MPTVYSKRKLTHTKREAWIPKEIDSNFRSIVPNYQEWVIAEMNKKINQTQREKK